MKTLLLVPDYSQAASIRLRLKINGWNIHEPEDSHDEDEAADLIRREDYDVIVLHQSLQALLLKLRLSSIQTPVVALVAGGAEARIKALMAGADDALDMLSHNYTAELEARMQAVARRGRGLASPKIQVGDVVLDLYAKQVHVGDHYIHLTGREYQVLEALMVKRRILSKSVIFDQLYANSSSEPEAEKIVDVFVCKIRKKLRAAGAPDLIKTIWGRGYQVAP